MGKRALAGTALLSLCALAACEVPSPQQRAKLNSIIGQDETTLVRNFGVPTRVYQTQGHRFLAYEQHDTSYDPGAPGFGWGWGGGWGGGYGGWGGGWGGGYGGWGGGWGGGGFPPSVTTFSCTTTFELVGAKVATWTLRGDGC